LRGHIEGKIMNKLKAIQKIVDANGIPELSKLGGILRVLQSDENEAGLIAKLFSISPKALQKRQKAMKKK
jgi:hypothetical protein